MSDIGSIRRIAVVVVAVVGIAIGGCGGGDRPTTIPISGRVTFDGKPPGERGKLYFAPTRTAEGYSKRPASGSYNAEGIYRVMTWEPDDGLVPGHYVVSVVPSNLAKTAVPTKYHQNATSGLEVEVPMDQSSVDFNIDVITK